MEQAIGMNDTHRNESTLQFRYGGGATAISLGVVFVLMVLYAYEPMTSGRIEWHLFLRSLPVIPHEIMVGLWWLTMAGAVAAIIVCMMPAVKVILDNDKITTQSIFTRKFETIRYDDILDIVHNKNYISVTDWNNNKIYLSKLFLSSSAFRTIGDKLRSKARNVH